MENNKKDVNPNVSKICMLVSAINMGCVGLFVTFLSKYPIYTIVLLRGIFGTIFLTIFILKSRSFNRDFIKESIKMHWKALILIGIINALVIYFYFISISICGYALAAFLLYTGGIFVILFLIISKEEKVSKINIISFILAVIGVAIIMEFWTGAGFTYGAIFGLLSGLMLGLLIFLKKKVYNKRKKYDINLKKSEGNFDLFLAWWPTFFLIIVFLPFGANDLAKLTFLDLIFCLILGFFPTALAFFLYNVGVKNDKGGNIIILSYFEPIMATINAFLFLKLFSIYTILGGVLILIANVIVLKYSK